MSRLESLSPPLFCRVLSFLFDSKEKNSFSSLLVCSKLCRSHIAFSWPLRAAVRAGNLPLCRLIYEASPSQVSRSRDGWLPLHEACQYQPQNTDLLRFLLEIYPEGVCSPTQHGSYPLHLLCSYGADNIEALSYLLQVFPNAARHRASVNSMQACVKAQEEEDEWVTNECDENGWLPLHYATRHFGSHWQSIRIILSVYPQAVLLRCEGWTAFHLALRYFPNESELLAILITVFPGCVLEPLLDRISPIDLWVHSGGTDARCQSVLQATLQLCSMTNSQIYKRYLELKKRQLESVQKSSTQMVKEIAKAGGHEVTTLNEETRSDNKNETNELVDSERFDPQTDVNMNSDIRKDTIRQTQSPSSRKHRQNAIYPQSGDILS